MNGVISDYGYQSASAPIPQKLTESQYCFALGFVQPPNGVKSLKERTPS